MITKVDDIMDRLLHKALFISNEENADDLFQNLRNLTAKNAKSPKKEIQKY